MSLATQRPLRALPRNPGRSRLTPVEVEVIDLFVTAFRLIGIPRSLGEIYGLLFLSPEPLTLDGLVERLQISKGSASQGLQVLRRIGAAKLTKVPHDRRDHYVAETEWESLVCGLIGSKLLPSLDAGESRLRRLRALHERADLLNSGPQAAAHRERLEKLEHWCRRARDLAHLLEKALC